MILWPCKKTTSKTYLQSQNTVADIFPADSRVLDFQWVSSLFSPLHASTLWFGGVVMHQYLANASPSSSKRVRSNWEKHTHDKHLEVLEPKVLIIFLKPNCCLMIDWIPSGFTPSSFETWSTLICRSSSISSWTQAMFSRYCDNDGNALDLQHV